MNKLNLIIFHWVKFLFNKGLDKDDKKEGLMKRLKNIEKKSENQLELIGNKEQKQLGIESVINILMKTYLRI